MMSSAFAAHAGAVDSHEMSMGSRPLTQATGDQVRGGPTSSTESQPGQTGPACGQSYDCADSSGVGISPCRLVPASDTAFMSLTLLTP